MLATGRDKVSQLNVRIDSSIRAAGDATLSELGYTAGEFIRAIWARLAQRGRAVEEIRAVLQGTSGAVDTSAQEDLPLARMAELASCVAKMCRTSASDAPVTPYDAADLDRERLWSELDDGSRWARS
jgi:hypothetical protein